jgi:hypothetical protein
MKSRTTHACLQYIPGCRVSLEVTPSWSCVRLINDIFPFMFRNTSPYDVIGSHFIQIVIYDLKGANFKSRTLFLFVGRSSGAFPSSKNFCLSSKLLGEASNQNMCAYGRSFSMPVGSSPISSHDRWLSWALFFPSHMIMSNSNS